MHMATANLGTYHMGYASGLKESYTSKHYGLTNKDAFVMSA